MAIKRVCDLDEIVLDSTTQRLQGEDLIEITQFQDEDRYISKKIKYDTLLSSIVKGVADRLSAVTDRMIRTTPPASAVPIGAIFYMTQRYDTVLSGSSGYDISACVNEDGELVNPHVTETSFLPCNGNVVANESRMPASADSITGNQVLADYYIPDSTFSQLTSQIEQIDQDIDAHVHTSSGA